MGYRKYLDTNSSVDVDDELIVETLNSGSGVTLGTIAIAALECWKPADLKSLAAETEPAEIEAVAKILAAMRGEA